MAKVTIKSLEERIEYLVGELNKGKEHELWQSREILKQKDQIAQQQSLISLLERDKQWAKQMAQNLSESICVRERNR